MFFYLILNTCTALGFGVDLRRNSSLANKLEISAFFGLAEVYMWSDLHRHTVVSNIEAMYREIILL